MLLGITAKGFDSLPPSLVMAGTGEFVWSAFISLFVVLWGNPLPARHSQQTYPDPNQIPLRPVGLLRQILIQLALIEEPRSEWVLALTAARVDPGVILALLKACTAALALS